MRKGKRQKEKGSESEIKERKKGLKDKMKFWIDNGSSLVFSIKLSYHLI